jgi:hypothetical protein
LLDSVSVGRASFFAGRLARAAGAAALRDREGVATVGIGGRQAGASNAKHMPTTNAGTLACKLLMRRVVKPQPSVR